jgi:lipopolysaccharide transport system ATP-binding protein
MRNAIEISNLSKQYILTKPESSGFMRSFNFLRKPIDNNEIKSFWALKDINLTVKEGEVVGIIGPNGAGKSTLLKIISQIVEPTHGCIKLYGKLGSILEVGMGFHMELTGRENIHLSAGIMGMDSAEIKKCYDKIVEFADIGEFIDVPVKHYSSGMYMRLAFAVCAFLNHEILILDEVLAVGDAAFQRKCMGRMHEEVSTGRTVLFVSHNLSAVQNLCTRAIYIDKGQIVFDGTPTDAIMRYIEAGSAPRNCVEWNDPATAPRNDLYRLKAVRVTDRAHQPIQVVENDQGFYVEVTYEVLKAQTPVGVTVAFFDPNQQCLFGTLSNKQEDWHGKPREKGVYVSRVFIKEDWFNKGVLSVTVLLWTSGYTEFVRVDQAIEVEVHDTGSIRGDYFSVMEGHFLPRFDWQTEKLTLENNE